MTKSNIIFIGSLAATVTVGYIDYLTGAHISMMLLYAVPILSAAWYCGKFEGVAVAASAAICWFSVNFLLHHGPPDEAALSWNAFSHFAIFSLLAYTVSLQVALKRVIVREQQNARRDPLTGLLNKWAFREQVENELARARRYGHPFSLAFIDLDNFKEVNDTHGHARGDHLLQNISETIQQAIRRTDCAGRVGGDEFTISFPETGPEHIQQVIDKLLLALDIMTSQSGWQVTASIGVVTYLDITDTYDAMLGKADRLMYTAKNKGKNGAEYLVISSDDHAQK